MGKSSVALHVGRKLEEEAGRYGVNFKHVYLNLRLESATRFILYSSPRALLVFSNQIRYSRLCRAAKFLCTSKDLFHGLLSKFSTL